MRSWICVVGLLFGTLGWSFAAGAQSIALSTPASSYQAPANFNVTITTANGTGSNKYRVQGATLVLTRNNQNVHTGTAAYAETNLPVGTYAYKATATAFNPVTLHEYVLSSNTINVTITAPPAPAGTVTATPNPCNIAMGSTTCSTTISWNSNNSGASVWVSDLSNNGLQLFANGQSGAQAATWITTAGSRFHLKVGSQTLSTVGVLGNPPPPPSGSISASPNPCTIAPGNTTCNITVNWSSVNAPTADVWASDLSNNGMVPFGNTPNGSQATVMPASTSKRMHLKFGALTLATVDIHAGAIPPPAGTLTASASSCAIAPGNTACPVTISWNTTNPTAKITLRMSDPNGNQETLFGSGPAGSKQTLIVASGMRFQLLNGAQVLGTVTVGATAPPAQPSVPHLAHRTETIEYQNDPSKWVMGQIKRRINVNTGLVESQTDYWPETALPQRTWRFGKPQQYFTYNADSTLATVTDGNNHTTTLSDWHRGIPRNIRFPPTPEAPAGSTQSAAVNDNGWITSTTDENGFSTSYGYDAMGRLASIVYPTGDSTAWNNVTMAFQQINANEHGLPAGHWRHSRYQGNKHVNTYYDALWRPVLEETLDAGDIGNTLSQTVKRYDQNGRLIFQSYPQRGVGNYWDITQGTHTLYDALDRPTSVSHDSEHGLLTTTTEYLPGFQTRTTNPRGQQTLTTIYQAYDQPSYDLPRGINHPEGTYTEIHRDVFGKPTALVRRNLDSSQRVARHYVYDNYQQLCKIVEPETGATVMDYDNAGNLQWNASGLALTSTSSCDTLAGRDSGRKVTRLYDARNRIRELLFPDGRGTQLWEHTPDGLPARITTWNDPNSGSPVVNAYSYNKRRMLTGETVEQPNWYGWGIGYGYDANGGLATQSYPTGLTVNFAPNALGQATQAGSYATGVQYYPNGAIKRFTYGNGLVHSMGQNARQMPARSTDSGGAADFAYSYDQNANVTHIWDHARDSGNGIYGRWMAYDGLDRLTDAGSCSFGGDCWHRFTYDALDNMKSWKLPGVKDYANYVYDASNRLTNVLNSGGASVIGLSYDVQGNLANKNGKTYAFDFGNRLRGTNEEWYLYDGHGRRVLNWRATEPGVLSQYSQSGQLIYDENYRASGRKATEYVYLGGSLLASRERNIDNNVYVTKYQHTDALGSPVAVTNGAGQVIDRTSYDPYGGAINKSVDGIGYTGHVMDAATGLTYMQQRYYDPMIGRFLSVDPVTANSGTGANFNRYWYGNNNPYKFTDPDGRIAIDELRKIMGSGDKPHPTIDRCNGGHTCYGGGGSKPNKTDEPQIPVAGSMGEFIENTAERIVRRTSFVASGGVAAGVGVDGEATKTTRPWQRDKVGVYGVIGLGGYVGANAKFRTFSWGDQSGTTGGKMKVNPLGYFKLKIGVGLSVGISASFNDHGGGTLSITGGGGIGAQAIVKPPATLGWEKEL